MSLSPSPAAVREALDELETAQIELYATFERPYKQCTLTARTLRLRQARAKYDQIMGIEPTQDLYPTCYDLEPVTGPPAPVAPVAAPAASTVTLIECAALGAVSGAERAVSPVSPFDVARGAVRLVAGVARLVRGRRS